MIHIIVKNKFILKPWINGNYEAFIEGNEITLYYANPIIAKQTYLAMINNKMNAYYDNDKKIVQKLDGYTEKQILSITKKELDLVIKSKLKFQQTSYEVIEV